MIFALEGVDGSGKSSILFEMRKKIGDQFLGKNVVYTKEPKYSKDMLAITNPFQQLYLFMADHERHLEEVIKPHINDIIFTDRYITSRVAYFAAHYTGLEETFWAGMYAHMLHDKKHVMGIDPYYPEVNYLLKVDEKTLEQHLSSRYKSNDIDPDEISRLMSIQDIYLQLARSDRDKFFIIDIASKKDTIDKILRDVERRLT